MRKQIKDTLEIGELIALPVKGGVVGINRPVSLAEDEDYLTPDMRPSRYLLPPMIKDLK